MNSAFITGVAYHLPETVETTQDLAQEHPEWNVASLAKKTGITSRHLSAPGECASDLAIEAANKLFSSQDIDRGSIDVLIACTQSPDYFLPTTACVMQDRLGLRTDCGAFDINLGCSGYVYGLSIARALIVSGQARNVLLTTADTYSKFIHPADRTVRLLFGDGAAATLVTADIGKYRIRGFRLGTDGSGAKNLIVPAGACRMPSSAETSMESRDEGGSVRSLNNLYMNGAEVFSFTLERVPPLVIQLLEQEGLGLDAVDKFVFHQANKFMLEHLCIKMGIPRDKMILDFEDCGNTVSSSIPIVLSRATTSGQLDSAKLVMLVGFGVGYSWGATLLERAV